MPPIPDPTPLNLTTTPTADAQAVPVVTLFTIDGTDYTMPRKPRANLALRYLWAVKEKGEMAAAGELLTRLLGEAGYRALMEYDDLTEDQLKQVIDYATKVTLGTMEVPKAA